MSDEVCPRPRLTRPGWVDLGGAWGFATDDGDQGVAEGWFRPGAVSDAAFAATITVPYPPESARSGVHDPRPHPVVWYRRELDPPPHEPGERVLLHFGAVDHRARVWLGGEYLGGHTGGHTPFTLDVTGAVEAGARTLVVRAEDPVDDGTQPRGKQDWQPEPHVIWYHRTTGIWQPVWLEVVPALHLTALHWTPDVARAAVTCEGELNQTPPEPVGVAVTLRLGGEVLAEQTVRVSGRRFRFDVAVPAARHGQDRGRLLWSPEHPVLIDAEVTVGADTVGSYLGLRDTGVADGMFLLNHTPYYLRLVLQQGYWPESHLAAPDGAALRREVELIKELGFNGVRIHQKVEDPRFLYWCDRLGLLVWGETANAYEFDATAVAALAREWLEVLERDRSHPCVVAWVPLNESWGVPDIAATPAQAHHAAALYHLTKAVDPTRPVLANDGWETPDADLYGVHDYAPAGASLRARFGDADALAHSLGAGRPGGRRVLLGARRDGAPVVLSEFGGLSFTPETGEHWFGYSAVPDADALLAKVEELVSAVLDSPVLAGFCWTQLTDTEQERNGLLTEGREPKVPPAALRAILTRPAASVPPEEVSAARHAAGS